MMRARILLAIGMLIATGLPLVGGSESEYKIIQLKGEAPVWWTEEARAMADLAGAQGKLYNPLTREFVGPEATAPVNLPVSPDYLFIRPGSLFLSNSGALCTYNFIYSSSTQIGAAGHCVAGVGEVVYILAVPAPTIPLVTRLGSVASFHNNGIGDDWSLMNIDAQWRTWVDPNMANVGGPSCSTWNGTGGVLKHTGHGIQTGLVASIPRVSQASASDGTRYTGVGEISGGDSGSPMIQVVANAGCAMGMAAGIVTHCASLTGLDCLPIYWASDIRIVPATVTVGLDPL